jgi:hypothetical protein
MSHITYGNHRFTAPALLGYWVLPSVPGVYAIQVINSTWGPFQYEPIYFGETSNLRQQVDLSSHEAAWRWWKHASSRFGLYVSWLREDDGVKRLLLEEELIAQYFPLHKHSLREPSRAVI